MSEEIDWITIRLVEARELYPTVTEAVSTRIEELLRGQLVERELSEVKLLAIAKALIADMAPTPPNMEPNQ